jgi:hypothetical protein
VTDIRSTFEALQHERDAETFGFPSGGPSLTRQEFAEECDINVLMAYGRCLRPALYSSLRCSPSHPTGVSALRVTIAIANARFARKQRGLRKSTAKSRRLLRKESATSRPVRGRYLRIHRNDPKCILSQIAARPERLLAWKLGPGASDQGGQDKSRKVRTVGSVRKSARFPIHGTHCGHLAQLAFFDNTLSAFGFCDLTGRS